jgi:membrane protein YdbS with pleckstrin-like domain
MYHVPPPKEPSGCLQTLVISRMILQILFIPLMLILGSIVAIVLFFFSLSVSPLLSLAILIMGVLALIAAAKWEWRRVGREMPPDEDL